ncbi:MAG TPA: heavy metal translocating P-type ATPase, partial [Thermoleophilia bacterium]|nr:heavy metal translocating P-type ATPase [Thermoleophilia bacterium]
MGHGSTDGDRPAAPATVVLDASGQWSADEGRIVERGLRSRTGVLAAAANPVAQTVTVSYDPAVTSPRELRDWILRCGYHCAGESVPRHICAPLPDDSASAGAPDTHEAAGAPETRHAGRHPDEAAGHAGHGGMSMAAMARDLRDRFIVAAVLAVPIMFWSPMGTALLGRELPAPFGVSSEVFQFLLSLPVVFYSSAIF